MYAGTLLNRRRLRAKENPVRSGRGVFGRAIRQGERELPIISVRARWRFFGFELSAVLGVHVPQPLQADMFAR